MQLFNNIYIIGLGLIGSSIARSLKKYDKSQNIFGFDANKDYITKAFELGIIDKADDTPESLAKNADLIILSIPLGAYTSILEKISPYLNENTIITDVGSVKKSVIEDVGVLLNIKNFRNFIPGHPIAGSEKSGIDAGSDFLFEGNQLILTPTAVSSADAINKITEFWENLGSVVSQINPEIHDRIYATSSHLPHFISFCFALALGKHNEDIISEIIELQDAEFKSFIRLAASNPLMWADVFKANKQSVLSSIKSSYYPPSLAQIKPKKSEDLLNRLFEAKEKRILLPHNTDIASNSEDKKVYAFTKILPKIIACITIESIQNFDHVGGGFLGLTENIIFMPENFSNIIEQNLEALNSEICLLSEEISKFYTIIESGTIKEIQEYIRSANEVFVRVNE